MNKSLMALSKDSISRVYYDNSSEVVVESAKEFCRFVNLISEKAITNHIYISLEEIVSPAIILATFENIPSLKEILSEDYQYLYDSDGFSIRQINNNIFITSHMPEGLHYGLHSLLEENAEIIWPRGVKPLDVEYIKKDLITLDKINYMQKSPFKYRGWNACGYGSEGLSRYDQDTSRYFGRNKVNTVTGIEGQPYKKYGVKVLGESLKFKGNIDYLAFERPDFFMMGYDGGVKLSAHQSFVNYYNPEVAEHMAQRLIQCIDENNAMESCYFIMPDSYFFNIIIDGVKLHELPFVTDEGVTVHPHEKNYQSTVFFNYINRIIKIINKKHPNFKIVTLAYIYSELAPNLNVDDNIIIRLAPIMGTDKYPYTLDNSYGGEINYENIAKWSKKSKSIVMYNYWMSFNGEKYTRPIVKIVQENLKFYQSLGIYGVASEGRVDSDISDKTIPYYKNRVDSNLFYYMNEMYQWQINRLLWDPDLNINKLSDKFCKIIYGNAKDAMKEFYRLIQLGWDKMDGYIFYSTTCDMYIKHFIIDAGIKDQVLDALNSALNLAERLKEKQRIQTILDTFVTQIEKYDKIENESLKALYTNKGRDKLLSLSEMDYHNNPDSEWNKATKVVNLKEIDTVEDFPQEAKFEARFLYDEENIYVGMCCFDDQIAVNQSNKTNYLGSRLYEREDGNFIYNISELYLGKSKNRFFGYFDGLFNERKAFQSYLFDGFPMSIPKPENYRSNVLIKTSSNPKERYYFYVYSISWKDLEMTYKDKLYLNFVVVNNRYGRGGWKGSGLWSNSNMEEILLIKE